MKLSKEEITRMNEVMKQLENGAEEIREFHTRLEEILSWYQTLQKFNEEKWMQYYDEQSEFGSPDLEILNQDSLYNALTDTYLEAKELLKTTVRFL